MKPKNNDAIIRAYLKFALYLSLTVCLAVMIFWTFLMTSSAEIEKIQKQAAIYDKEYTQTIDLVNGADSIYTYLTLLNKPTLDNTMLSNVISTKKVILQKRMELMNRKDYILFSKLNSNINYFLNVKDSIRSQHQKEEMVRNELKHCLDDNRQAVRKASIIGIKQ
jgi:hypothetical protein